MNKCLKDKLKKIEPFIDHVSVLEEKNIHYKEKIKKLKENQSVRNDSPPVSINENAMNPSKKSQNAK
jgi:hypothetical protein